MKKVSLLIVALITTTSLDLFAAELVVITEDVLGITLGYGDGSFPVGTVQSQDGNFQIVLNQKIQFKSLTFAENFDSMCEVEASLQNNAIQFKIFASSADSSRCVLNYELSNGETGQIIGFFSSGE